MFKSYKTHETYHASIIVLSIAKCILLKVIAVFICALTRCKFNETSAFLRAKWGCKSYRKYPTTHAFFHFPPSPIRAFFPSYHFFPVSRSRLRTGTHRSSNIHFRFFFHYLFLRVCFTVLLLPVLVSFVMFHVSSMHLSVSLRQILEIVNAEKLYRVDEK